MTVAASPAGIVADQNGSSGAPAMTSAMITTVVPSWRSTSTAVTQPSCRRASNGSE